MEKGGGTTGVLNRKADDGRRKEIERERQTYARVTECRDTAFDTEEASGHQGKRHESIYIYINKGKQQQKARIGYNRTGRRTDADACSSARKGIQDGGAAGSARSFLRAARASLKTRTQESYGAREKDRERSVRIRSDNTSSPLRAIPPSSSSPSFYRSRREPFGH